MTCRLPQTPRTPTAAAAHYFDDIWSTTGKPKKPHHLRRSSTSRSIGFRSDWEGSATGDDAEGDKSSLNRTNSIGYLDADALRRKQEMDQHVAHYVSDQLSRIQSGDSNEFDSGELEASLDGALEMKPNGRKKGREGYFSK
jgi:hypothetical protein